MAKPWTSQDISLMPEFNQNVANNEQTSYNKGFCTPNKKMITNE